MRDYTSENDTKSVKIEIISSLLLNGLISAHYAHDSIFKNVFSENNHPPLAVAIGYLTEAYSSFTMADTFFKDNQYYLEQIPEIGETIHQFKVFNDEFLNNVRTDHSHQWTNIEFNRFVESFKTVASILKIENSDYWIDLALKED